MSEWRTMETAPRDGKPFLAFQPEQEDPYFREAMMAVMEWHNPSRRFVMSHVDGREYEQEIEYPTYWRPLPEPPGP